jgi:protein-L-isoaspartate(D-aspartate) O-methyltransferase
MVRQQVRTGDVFDAATLAVLDDLDRHDFVPPRFASLAYADTEIPLGHDQVMMAPIIEGRLLQALDLSRSDRVLEIGTGSGYLTACLARLAGSVVSLDIFADFSEAAAQKLEHANIANAELHTMDAMEALPDEQFDAIAVTGSLTEFDERFVAALKPGGRLFVIVGEAPVMQAQKVARRADGRTVESALFETCIPTLINAGQESTFSF